MGVWSEKADENLVQAEWSSEARPLRTEAGAPKWPFLHFICTRQLRRVPCTGRAQPWDRNERLSGADELRGDGCSKPRVLVSPWQQRILLPLSQGVIYRVDGAPRRSAAPSPGPSARLHLRALQMNHCPGLHRPEVVEVWRHPPPPPHHPIHALILPLETP